MNDPKSFDLAGGIISSIHLTPSNVCSAFNPTGIGTRVLDAKSFQDALAVALLSHDCSKDRVPGQHAITLAGDVLKSVSAGVGKRSKNPSDYVVREHRGTCGLYLRREHASQVESLVVIVYTTLAYLSDPEIKGDALREIPANEDEIKRINRWSDERDALSVGYVVVAVLASAGPRAQLSPARFVSNLTGGNREAAVWSADEIRQKAQDIKNYDAEWCVVAD